MGELLLRTKCICHVAEKESAKIEKISSIFSLGVFNSVFHNITRKQVRKILSAEFIDLKTEDKWNMITDGQT